MKALLIAAVLATISFGAMAQCPWVPGHYNVYGVWVPGHCRPWVAPPYPYVAPFGVAPYPGWVWSPWGGRWGWHSPDRDDRRDRR